MDVMEIYIETLYMLLDMSPIVGELSISSLFSGTKFSDNTSFERSGKDRKHKENSGKTIIAAVKCDLNTCIAEST